MIRATLPREIRKRKSPVAARDYWTKNWIRRWISGKIFHAVLLNRKGRPEDRSHPLQGVFDMLESGRSIIIFPEVTRSPDGSLSNFKPGIFHVRERFPECVMIPVSLQNLNRILPKGQSLPVPLIGRISVRPPLEVVEGKAGKGAADGSDLACEECAAKRRPLRPRSPRALSSLALVKGETPAR